MKISATSYTDHESVVSVKTLVDNTNHSVKTVEGAVSYPDFGLLWIKITIRWISWLPVIGAFKLEN